MANYITTLKDDNGTNNLLPKTVLKAVADDNGNYLDNGLAASDINKLKGGEIVKLEENLARIETSPTTHAYSVGERLVYNGILYRVKAAISNGDDLVVDTNIEKKSVDDALSDIKEHFDYGYKAFDVTQSGTLQTKHVDFNKTFSKPPVVIVCWAENNVEDIGTYCKHLQVVQSSVTTTGFDAGTYRLIGGGSWGFYYFAFEAF